MRVETGDGINSHHRPPVSDYDGSKLIHRKNSWCDEKPDLMVFALVAAAYSIEQCFEIFFAKEPVAVHRIAVALYFATPCPVTEGVGRDPENFGRLADPEVILQVIGRMNHGFARE